MTASLVVVRTTIREKPSHSQVENDFDPVTPQELAAGPAAALR